MTPVEDRLFGLSAHTMATTKPRPGRSDFYTGDKVPQTSIPHGTGTYVYSNKYFTYTGEWVNGVKHGQGTLTMGDGSTYEGTFVDGEITGQGLRRWPDGSTYSGQFRRGEFCGEGIYRGLNGETYEGEFLDNKRHGEGELVLSDGSVYQGHFDGHRKHGAGTLTTAAGDVLRGTFEFNELRAASCTYADGSTYEGELRDLKRHGQGKLVDNATGLLHEGEFADGQRVEWPALLRPAAPAASEAAEVAVGGEGEELVLEAGAPVLALRLEVCTRVQLHGEAAVAAAAAAAAQAAAAAKAKGGAKGAAAKKGAGKAGAKGAAAGGKDAANKGGGKVAAAAAKSPKPKPATKDSKGGKKKPTKGKGAEEEEVEPVFAVVLYTAESGRRVTLELCVEVHDDTVPEDAPPALKVLAAIDPATVNAEDVPAPPEPAAAAASGGDDETKAACEGGDGAPANVDPLDALRGARRVVAWSTSGVVQVPSLGLVAELPPGDYVLRATDATPNLPAGRALAPHTWRVTVEEPQAP